MKQGQDFNLNVAVLFPCLQQLPRLEAFKNVWLLLQFKDLSFLGQAASQDTDMQ